MDVVVIGAGAAGLTAALKLAQSGRSVALLTKGIGGLQLSQGTVDILGYGPQRVDRPLDAISELASRDPGHPYAAIGSDAVRRGVEYFAKQVGPDLLTGDPDDNVLLPTAVGAVRPTALAQPSMMAGQVADGKKYAIVGLRRMKDFYPELVAANLNRAQVPGGGHLSARALMVDVPARDGDVDSSALVYARAFDDAAFRRRLAAAFARQLSGDEVVGMPAMLGIKNAAAWSDFERELGQPVFEIPLPPPSVPGMRLNEKLTGMLADAGVRIIMGSKVIGAQLDGDRVAAVSISSAGRARSYAAHDFIFAPGGFESGALAVDSYMTVSEPVFGLPLRGLEADELISEKYWDADQPLFRVGVAVNEEMKPVTPAGDVVYHNLFAVGGMLAGATRWAEKSGEGIALGSAVRAAETITGEA
jgi:glycerol-3-phosphate dehydrogenase subunit B